MKRLFLFLALLPALLFAQTTKVGGSGSTKVGGSGTTKVSATSSGADPGTPHNWYKANTGSGTTLTDDGSVPTNATISDAAMWGTVDGFQCVTGNGSSYNIATGSSVTLGSNKVTVSFWLRNTSWTIESDVQMVFETSPAYFSNPGSIAMFGDYPSTNFICAMSGSTSGTYFVTCPIITTSTWTFVAAVFDMTGPSITVYYNGVAQSTTPTNNSFTGSTSFSAQKFNMDARNAGGSLWSVSSLDDIRVFTTALTASNVVYLNAHRQ